MRFEDGSRQISRAIVGFRPFVAMVNNALRKEPVLSTRQNHALEHATITILLHRAGVSPPPMAGRSDPEGFSVYGDVRTEELEDAVAEALRRLQSGERDLAVSPFCGTNIALGGLLAAVGAAAAIGGQNRVVRLPNAILAATFAILVSRPLGRLAQKYVTTSPDLQDVRVRAITKSGWGSFVSHRVHLTRDRWPAQRGDF
jgi:hypothetical protein